MTMSLKKIIAKLLASLDWQIYHPTTLTRVSCSGTITENTIYVHYVIIGSFALASFMGRARISSMTRSSSNPGFEFDLPFTPKSTTSYTVGGVAISGGAIRQESVYFNTQSNGTAQMRITETNVNASNGNFILSGSFFAVIPLA